MEFKLFGLNLDLWKLHTPGDYLQFFLFLVGGILLLRYATKRLGKKRNDVSAAQRVGAKLQKLGKKACVLLTSSVLPQGDGHADELFVSPRGVFAVRTVGWGYRVQGSIRAAEWIVKDNQETRRIPNPLKQAQLAAAAVETALRENAVADVTVLPMVVFADPFDNARFNLEGGAQTYAFNELKKWYKSLPENAVSPETIERIAGVFAKQSK